MPASAPPASAAAATKPTLGKCLRSHAFLESSIASSPAESLWPIDDFTPHPIDHTRGAPSPLNPTPIPRAGRFPYNRRRNFAGLMRGCTLRSEEHTSEHQSLMRTSYSVLFLTK